MSQSEKSVQHSTNLIMKKHNKVGYRAILLFISFLLTGCKHNNGVKATHFTNSVSFLMRLIFLVSFLSSFNLSYTRRVVCDTPDLPILK